MKAGNIKTLEGLGLTENESKVYLAALSLGPTTVMKIAKLSGVPRTMIYDIIETLQSKALMSIEHVGLKKRYAAESPQKLELMLEHKRTGLENLLPELMATYNTGSTDSSIKYYEGLDAVKGVYTDLLNNKDTSFFYGISNSPRWYGSDPDFFGKFIEKRAKTYGDIKLILRDSELTRKYKKLERNFNQSIKIMSADMGITSSLTITPEKYVVHQLVEPISAIVVENKSLVDTQVQLFNFMWDALPE